MGGTLKHVQAWLWHQAMELGRVLLRKHRQAHPIDRKYGIETTQIIGGLAIETGSAQDKHNNAYVGVQPSVLKRCLDLLPIDENTAFIDLGCGKGRPLAIAMEYPFGHVIGVELSPVLCGIARKNARILARINPNGAKISIVEGDATKFENPGCEKLVVFLYNPFDGPVCEQVLAHVEKNIAPNAKVFLIYCNPVQHDVFDRSKTLTRFFAEFIPYSDKELAVHAFANKGDSVIIYQSQQKLLAVRPGANAAIRITIPRFGCEIA